jgi:hypothetical protein
MCVCVGVCVGIDRVPTPLSHVFTVSFQVSMHTLIRIPVCIYFNAQQAGPGKA